MTQDKTWEGSNMPNFGRLLLLGALAIVILLILAFLSQGGGGASGGPVNPQPPKWSERCTSWEPLNEELLVVVDLVMSWFAPGGVLAGQQPSVLASMTKEMRQSLWGVGSDAYFSNSQYRGLTSQIYSEWNDRGMCYPGMRDDQMDFIIRSWGN